MSHIKDYLELTKPRLITMALIAVAVGFVLGSPSVIRWPLLLVTLLGTGLVGAGGQVLNQWWERDADALMERTKHRPLPTGRLHPVQALQFGIGLTMAGLLVLAVGVNAMACALAAWTFISYVFLYTPLKKHSSLCTLVGAIPGAMPPLIGWTAAGRGLSLEAGVLFAILFLWQLPHFLAIAWVHRADYARAGFQVLPVVDPAGTRTGRYMVLYGLALWPISLLPTVIGLSGSTYFVGASLIGLWFVGMAAVTAYQKSPEAARRLFLASIGYLPTVLLMLVVDRRWFG